MDQENKEISALTDFQEIPPTQHERLVLALTEKGISAEDIVKLIGAENESNIKLLQTQNDILLSRSRETKKYFLAVISTLLILIPLIPAINPYVSLPIASIGAVGFATSLYSVFGKEAFNAGRKFRRFFKPNKSKYKRLEEPE